MIMTHDEIVKECDRISKSEHESWNYIFRYLKDREHEKLNNSKWYECQETLSWYADIKEYDEVLVSPFGFIFIDYLNQLISLNSKDAFIRYEKRMREGAQSEKDINPTFDKYFRFFIWNYNKGSDYDNVSNLSETELTKIYDGCCWLWEYINNDVNSLIKCLEYQNNHEVTLQYISDIYNFVRKLVLKVWMLQNDSDMYDKKHKRFYNAEDFNICLTDEYIENKICEIDEMLTYDFIEKMTVSQFRYMGLKRLTPNHTEVCCKKYDVFNLLAIVPEDLMHLMLHQKTHKFEFCIECGYMFIITHGNRKYCPACNKNIRQKKRKENSYRYTHKKITDFLNTNSSEENPSEMFRNESNYYWKIVQGNMPKTPKESWYRDDIKTKDDYKKWLDDELLRYKKLKKEDAL